MKKVEEEARKLGKQGSDRRENTNKIFRAFLDFHTLKYCLLLLVASRITAFSSLRFSFQWDMLVPQYLRPLMRIIGSQQSQRNPPRIRRVLEINGLLLEYFIKGCLFSSVKSRLIRQASYWVFGENIIEQHRIHIYALSFIPSTKSFSLITFCYFCFSFSH